VKLSYSREWGMLGLVCYEKGCIADDRKKSYVDCRVDAKDYVDGSRPGLVDGRLTDLRLDRMDEVFEVDGETWKRARL